MTAYRAGFREIETNPTGRYWLMQLDIRASVLNVQSFSHLGEATAAFDAAEVAATDQDELAIAQDAVLVSVDSINSLRAAYPNYFLDTSVFLERVARIVQV
jgi:hypothetical protein